MIGILIFAKLALAFGEPLSIQASWQTFDCH